MRIAILSDIHGNFEALQAVLAAAEGLGAGAIWSLGDIVGYGPDPGPCVAAVRRAAAVSLLGNHDAAVTGAAAVEDFNDFARWAVEWTASVIAPDDRVYLAALPLAYSRDGLLAVHASPFEPDRWHYVHGTADALEHFGHFRERVCFLGHSHRPFIIAHDGGGAVVRCGAAERLKEGRRYLVNVGSVGQPRDRDPRACFCLYDDVAGEVSLHRVEYPVSRTQERMRVAGVPAFLVDRIGAGV